MGRGILAIVLSAALIGSGCTPWIDIAISDIPIVLQIVTSILSIVAIAQGKGQADPAMIAEIQNIAAQAQTDIKTVQSLINDYKAASKADQPGVVGKIDAALSAAQRDLQGLLAAFHVKNTSTQAEVAAGIGLALTTVQAIYSLLPPAPPSTAMPTGRTIKKTPPHKPRTPADLKTEYNAIVSSDFPDAVIH
jgi:hypothetical protein